MAAVNLVGPPRRGLVRTVLVAGRAAPCLRNPAPGCCPLPIVAPSCSGPPGNLREQLRPQTGRASGRRAPSPTVLGAQPGPSLQEPPPPSPGPEHWSASPGTPVLLGPVSSLATRNPRAPCGLGEIRRAPERAPHLEDLCPQFLSCSGGLSECCLPPGSKGDQCIPWCLRLGGCLRSCRLCYVAQPFPSIRQKVGERAGQLSRAGRPRSQHLESLHPSSAARLLCDLDQGLPPLSPSLPSPKAGKAGVAPDSGCTIGWLGYGGSCLLPWAQFILSAKLLCPV